MGRFFDHEFPDRDDFIFFKKKKKRNYSQMQINRVLLFGTEKIFGRMEEWSKYITKPI